MKFEQLKPNYYDMDYDSRVSFIATYVEKRNVAITEAAVTIKSSKSKAKSKKGGTIKVNKEQLALLKALGLV